MQMDENKITGLINDCEQHLFNIQSDLLNTKILECPVVIVLFGKEADDRECLMEMYYRLKKEWGNNINNISFVHLYMKDNQVMGRLLFDNSSEDTYNVIIDNARIKTQQAAKGVYATKSRIKLELIVNASDLYWKEYYESIKKIIEIRGFNVLSSIYLLLDQSTEENMFKTKEVIKQVNEDINRYSSVYLLSNWLQNGDLLTDNKENYDIIANLILVCNANEYSGKSGVYNTHTFKTVSYGSISKPIREIVVASMKTLIDSILNKVSATANKVSADSLYSKFDINSDRIGRLESKYSNLFDKGMIIADDLSCMLYRESPSDALKRHKTSLRDFYKNTYRSGEILIDRYINEPIDSWLVSNRKKVAKELVDTWSNQLNYKNKIIHYELDSNFVRHIRNITPQLIKSKDASYEKIICDTAYYEGKKKFYSELVEEIIECISVQYENAVEFEKLLNKFIANIGVQVINEQKLNDIMVYYEPIVRKYVDDKVDSGFTGNETFDELCNIIREIIFRMFDTEDIYKLSFYEETERRFLKGGKREAQLYIKNYLDMKVDTELRIKVLAGYDKMSTFYFINEDTSYMKVIRDEHPEADIFSVRRKEGIEKIEIYVIGNVDSIDFMV